jgi:hypothetical protein
LYGSMSGLADTDYQYFEALATIPAINNSDATALIQVGVCWLVSNTHGSGPARGSAQVHHGRACSWPPAVQRSALKHQTKTNVHTAAAQDAV